MLLRAPLFVGGGIGPRWAPTRHLRLRAEGQATSLSQGASEELLALLQRPGAVEDLREIVEELLSDPERRGRFNTTAARLRGVAPGAAEADGATAADMAEDPLLRLLAEPAALTAALQDPGGAREQLESVAGSELLEELRELGTAALERLQLKRLVSGSLVELCGLQARPALNGIVGVLADATPAEAEEFEGRRIVIVEGGERLALNPKNLALPKHRPGDAVTLEADFAGEEEGLEGRAALVSELTETEKGLGFDGYGGRVVVDVLPLLAGGPIVQRLLMWPEHLRPRPFQPGDSVELQGLEANGELNGKPATVVPASDKELALAGGEPGCVAVALVESGDRLLVRGRNLRLTGVGMTAARGLR